MATGKLEDVLYKAIRSAIESEVSAAFDIKKEELIKELDRRKDEICAGVVLHAEKLVDFQTMDNRLVITIRKIDTQKAGGGE